MVYRISDFLFVIIIIVIIIIIEKKIICHYYLGGRRGTGLLFLTSGRFPSAKCPLPFMNVVLVNKRLRDSNARFTFR